MPVAAVAWRVGTRSSCTCERSPAVTFPASQIVEAQWTARDRRLQRFVTEQPPYSILVRGMETDGLPTCARHGMAVMSYGPLAGGWDSR